MKYNFTRFKILSLLSLITCSAIAQDFDVLQATNAVMLQVTENTRTETLLKGVTIGFLNSNDLTVRFNMPYDTANRRPADNNLSSATDMPFNLKVTIDPHIQEYITSTKTFTTHGMLTLNDSTKPVTVQYMPLPAVPDQTSTGGYNISIIIQFNPAEFNIDDQHGNSSFIIKIGNTPVNRL